MKIGIITKTNQKGQLVIPKKFRDALNINPNVSLQIILREHGIHVYPVEQVVTKGGQENIYPKILEKTQGTWSKENWQTTRKKRRKVEINASKKRKQQW